MKSTESAAASAARASGRRPEPKLLDRVREAVRVRHYSRRTEQAYVTWIRRFIVFHGKKHPSEMGSDEIGRYLTYLAVERRVSASTQNQALSALLFLYRQVLRLDPGAVDHVPHAHSPIRVPVVLSVDEVRAVLDQLTGIPRMIVALLYGPGSDFKSLSNCASKTSISTAIRSWSGVVRGRRIVERCSPRA